MTAVVLANRLGARPSGPAKWTARCPAHQDRSPSLSIGEGDGGRILLHCWAGCATSDVLTALGLSWRDLGGVADPVAARRVRAQHLANDDAARKRLGNLADTFRREDGLAARIAARLAALECAGATPRFAGEADLLTRAYHDALDRMREADAIWDAEVNNAK